ncbi:MAG: MarR family transcriptional regulator, partial [bacterium]
AKREGGFLIAKIHQIAGRVFARLLKEHGIEDINPAQGRILFALWQQDQVPIHVLARQTALKKSTLTSMLDRLEDDGFITRSVAPEDRRIVIVMLTDKSRYWQDIYTAVSDEMIGIFYAGMPVDEITIFEKQLKQILTNLTNYERHAIEQNS